MDTVIFGDWLELACIDKIMDSDVWIVIDLLALENRRFKVFFTISCQLQSTTSDKPGTCPSFHGRAGVWSGL